MKILLRKRKITSTITTNTKLPLTGPFNLWHRVNPSSWDLKTNQYPYSWTGNHLKLKLQVVQCGFPSIWWKAMLWEVIWIRISMLLEWILMKGSLITLDFLIFLSFLTNKSYRIKMLKMTQINQLEADLSSLILEFSSLRLNLKFRKISRIKK